MLGLLKWLSEQRYLLLSLIKLTLIPGTYMVEGENQLPQVGY